MGRRPAKSKELATSTNTYLRLRKQFNGNTYDLFPIKYHHVHIRDHGDIFEQLIDSCSHLLSSSKDKWNCDTTTTFFDENDIIPPDELGQFLAPYLCQYFPPG